jgi:hypothetical protein
MGPSRNDAKDKNRSLGFSPGYLRTPPPPKHCIFSSKGSPSHTPIQLLSLGVRNARATFCPWSLSWTHCVCDRPADRPWPTTGVCAFHAGPACRANKFAIQTPTSVAVFMSPTSLAIPVLLQNPTPPDRAHPAAPKSVALRRAANTLTPARCCLHNAEKQNPEAPAAASQTPLRTMHLGCPAR